MSQDLESLNQVLLAEQLRQRYQKASPPFEQNTEYKPRNINRILNIEKIRNIGRYIDVQGRLPLEQWKRLCNFLKYDLGCYAERKLVNEFGPAKIISMIEECAAAEQEGAIKTTPGQWFQGYIKKLRLKQAC